jgi:ATP synthase protein I
VSQLEEHFLAARRVALAIVVGQVGLTLLASVVSLLLGGPRASVSALLGGGIGTLASLYMVVSMFRLGPNAEPTKILRGVYRGEFYKLAMTAGLFWLVLVSVELPVGPMLGTFAVTLIAYWVALGLHLPDMAQK